MSEEKKLPEGFPSSDDVSRAGAILFPGDRKKQAGFFVGVAYVRDVLKGTSNPDIRRNPIRAEKFGFAEKKT